MVKGRWRKSGCGKERKRTCWPAGEEGKGVENDQGGIDTKRLFIFATGNILFLARAQKPANDAIMGTNLSDNEKEDNS